MVGASHERAGLHMSEARRLGNDFVLFKLLRCNITINRQVFHRGLQVLSDCHHIAAMKNKIFERSNNLTHGFTHANHKSRLGGEAMVVFSPLQKFQ